MNKAAPTQTVPALEMRGVAVNSIRTPHLVTVAAADWTVAPGDFWVIGGLHGSGKGDLLMLAAGMMAPASGEFFLFGNAMPIFSGERLGQRLRAGLVFAGGNLLNHLTVAENIALPLRYHRDLPEAAAQAEVRELLDLTGLADWADSTPGAIPLDWRKRAGLARALILRPEVLLLDNPLAGLDGRQGAWWLNFLGELSHGLDWMKGRPVTLAATTLDFRPWRNCARQFAVLKDKKLVVIGSWAQLEAAGDELVRELAATHSNL